jgi:segregation and condensation protein B
MENEEQMENNEGAVGNISSETAQELDEGKEVENLKKLEAALFLSARFLSLNDLVMLTDINPLMLRELIEKLKEKYNSVESSIEIVAKEDLWKMDVKQEYVGMINKLATGNAEFTKAEQETLAVVAYKQPVKQSVIIKIRGNKAYEHVKHFIEIGLVSAKRVGHTKELRLSDEFFEYFHLQKKGDGSTEMVINNEDGEEKVVVGDVEDVGEIEEDNSGEEKKDEKEEVIGAG